MENERQVSSNDNSSEMEDDSVDGGDSASPPQQTHDSDIDADPDRTAAWPQRFLKERRKRSVEKLYDKLQASLDEAGSTVVDVLLKHLKSKGNKSNGLSLPASAIGWLSIEMYSSEPRTELSSKLAELRILLPRATHVRVTGEPWPSLPKSSRKKKQRQTAWSNFDKFRQSSSHLDEEMEEKLVFLGFFRALMSRPPIDMSLFPNCEVLMVETISSSCIRNMKSVLNSLQVLRIEDAAVVDLKSFLVTSEMLEPESLSSSEDPLANPKTRVDHRSLFPNLTHLKLSGCSLSELYGLAASNTASPPLSYLTNLKSLCLARNEIASERALVGLSRMPYLAKVDLSYNQIEKLGQAHYHLGNIQSLVLSHNKLTSADGIERLFALQELWLDNNHIEDLSKISALARLPELESLHLRGNPIEAKAPLKFRVETLALFQEKRKTYLPRNATYRELRDLLPSIDDKRATMAEMKALKNRAFLPATVPSPPAEQAGAGLVIDLTMETGICERVHGGAIVPTRGAKRKFKARRAEIDKARNHVVLKPLEETMAASDSVPETDFTLEDVLRSLKIGAREESEQANISDCPNEDVDDVGMGDPPIDGNMNGPPAGQIDSANFSSPIEDTGDVRVIESVPRENEPSNPALPPDPACGEQNDLHGLKLSPVKDATKYEATEELKKSTTTTEATPDSPERERENVIAESEVGDAPQMTPVRKPLLPKGTSQLSDSVSYDEQSSFQGSLASPNLDASASVRKFQSAEDNSTYDGPAAFGGLKICSDLELYFRSFVFPLPKEEDWGSQPNGEEENEDKQWKRLMEREPRIQLWPADRKLQVASRPSGLSMNDSLPPEEFRKLWKERVVGCGKAALKRLTPNRGARYGFHGELLWSDSSSSHLRPDTVAEYRSVIACFSSSCFYLIADHDKVSARSRKRFPLPVSKQAEFFHAVWPHAFARHPLLTLKSIVIGFGFQRLTLCFGESNADSGDDFIYVLLTSNKSETVTLLKEIQDLYQENQVGGNMFEDSPEVSLPIENDDRHVLDALGVAVAPDVVGVVLHYQILGQRWKRGDRGVARRVCVVTDSKLFLLDEDYVGDGSESVETGTRQVGETVYRLVDSAALTQITQVQAADTDPAAITVVIRPFSTFQKMRNWRLQCRDRLGAERLVDDVRKALAMN